jgi:hypothetical protein
MLLHSIPFQKHQIKVNQYGDSSLIYKSSINNNNNKNNNTFLTHFCTPYRRTISTRGGYIKAAEFLFLRPHTKCNYLWGISDHTSIPQILHKYPLVSMS